MDGVARRARDEVFSMLNAPRISFDSSREYSDYLEMREVIVDMLDREGRYGHVLGHLMPEYVVRKVGRHATVRDTLAELRRVDLLKIEASRRGAENEKRKVMAKLSDCETSATAIQNTLEIEEDVSSLIDSANRTNRDIGEVLQDADRDEDMEWEWNNTENATSELATSLEDVDTGTQLDMMHKMRHDLLYACGIHESGWIQKHARVFSSCIEELKKRGAVEDLI